MSARERLRKRLMIGEPTHAICHPMQPERSSSASFVQTPNQSIQHPKHDMPISNQNSWETALFATHSSFAVLDLGASKTVIGADHVQGLIEGLDPAICKNLSRCECDVTFRFGNEGTLSGKMALAVPLGKIAVVPGKTPFLISNTLLRTLAAQIDCQHRQFRSAMLDQPIDMQLTSRGLFLVDLNEIPLSPQRFARSCRDSAKSVTETYLSDTAPRQNQRDHENQSPKVNLLKSVVKTNKHSGNETDSSSSDVNNDLHD